MTAPTITDISFSQPYYQAGQSIAVTVTYQVSNQYTSNELYPVITDFLTGEVSQNITGIFNVEYNGTGPEAYLDSFSGTAFTSYWNSFAANGVEGNGVNVAVSDNQAVTTFAGNGDNPGLQWAGITASTAASLVGSSFSFCFAQMSGAVTEYHGNSFGGLSLCQAQASNTITPAAPFLSVGISSPSSYPSPPQFYCSVNDTQIVSMNYVDSTNYARIRESLGIIYWDTSSDGANWTNVATVSDSSVPFDLTSLYATLYGTDGGSDASTVAFTNYAYIPEGAGIPDPTTASATDTGNRTWTLVSNTITGDSPPFGGSAIFTATA